MVTLFYKKTNKVNFITSKPCISRTTSHITKGIDTLLDLYEAIFFNMNDVHGYKKFNIKKLKSHLLPILTHIYGKEEYFGIIEQMIRVIKECVICM